MISYKPAQRAAKPSPTTETTGLLAFPNKDAGQVTETDALIVKVVDDILEDGVEILKQSATPALATGNCKGSTKLRMMKDVTKIRLLFCFTPKSLKNSFVCH